VKENLDKRKRRVVGLGKKNEWGLLDWLSGTMIEGRESMS